jgi:hypothetical protein
VFGLELLIFWADGSRNCDFVQKSLSKQAHRLIASASASVNRNSFAAELICQFVGFIDGVHRGFFAEIYGFADCCVTMLLEGSLHPDMPLWTDVIS